MSSYEELLRRSSLLSRRSLLRGMGVAGIGTLGMALPGCQSRPEDDIIDTSSDPELVQLGGTVTGTVTGLLDGGAIALAIVRIKGLGNFVTDRDGRFEFRSEEIGEYPVTVVAADHVKRDGRMRLNGNVSLALSVLEREAGLTPRFLEEYVHGIASAKEGVAPRTPGHTNRWTSTPEVVIYRRLVDDAKGVIPDARLSAMQASIAALFPPLTAFRLGSPQVVVRNEIPPDGLGGVPAGTIAVAQSRRRAPRMVQGGTVSNPWAIGQARTECRVDSPIDLFNRMFAHTLGAWVVTAGASVVNPAGAAAPSDEDLLAARFLYSRQPGNEAPDTDAPGVYLNA